MSTQKTKDLIIEETIIENVILIDSETNLPTVATIRGSIKRIWRDRSTKQVEESPDNFLPSPEEN